MSISKDSAEVQTVHRTLPIKYPGLLLLESRVPGKQFIEKFPEKMLAYKFKTISLQRIGLLRNS